MKEIKGRWFILIPMILYALFILWSYFPIFFYVLTIIIFTFIFIGINIYIYRELYKPYYLEKIYFENKIKGRFYYKENGVEQHYIDDTAKLKAKYDKFKYYYIGFWSQMFYDYIILSSCNGINYIFNQLIKICIYIDEKLTVKL